MIDDGVEVQTVMVAGVVEIGVSDSEGMVDAKILLAGTSGGKNDTLQAVAGWWLFEETETDAHARPKFNDDDVDSLTDSNDEL